MKHQRLTVAYIIALAFIICILLSVFGGIGYFRNTAAMYASSVHETHEFTINCIESGSSSYIELVLNNMGAETSGDLSAVVFDGYSMPVIAVPAKNGFVFCGYWTAAEGGVQIFNATGVALEGVTFSDIPINGQLYAHWTPIN